MAGRSCSSYTASPGSRQPPPGVSRLASTACLVLALAPLLGGCAGIMMPLSSWMSPTPPAGEEVTGSIPKPTVAVPTADSDGDVIRRHVEAAVAAASDGPVAWTNPTTGDSGTISRLTAVKANNGAPCRDFETTVTTIGGVRLYRGRACQGYAGPWDLVRLESDDGGAPLGFAPGPAASTPASAAIR